ncbi:hypothetical protein SLEP1_g24453 [Rubroshorea leprosula]|uniref:Uncharacterized protein n=1 Tax=Rubroshorea leprosula TaxID=152421 RepID=A0AAV5JRA3_9ROSI|nr:hypothetical protein SLEP1_g24453 [Rubroshorea leprosula]
MKKENNPWTGLEFNAKQEDLQWLEGCMVGIVYSIESIPLLQEKIFMEGYFSCKVHAISGMLVLLEGGIRMNSRIWWNISIEVDNSSDEKSSSLEDESESCHGVIEDGDRGDDGVVLDKERKSAVKDVDVEESLGS